MNHLEPETHFNDATGQWQSVERCWRCGEVITDWTYAVEGNDGNPVCGSCYQGSVDTAHDEVKDAQQGRGGQ